MNLFSLTAALGLDTSEFEEGLQDAQEKTEGLKGKLKEIAGSNEQVSKGFGKLKTAAMVAGGALAAGFGVGAKYGIELDSTMKKLQAQTGKTDEEIKKIETSLRNVYKSGAGESIEEVGEAFAYATQVMGGTNEELEKVTANAFTFSDTFGVEVNESIETVNGMMKTFGISSDEAFNILAQGAQQGANAQGDLLETVREFAPAFNEMGFSASDMVNVLVEGGQEGAFQVNKIADAMNEFTTKATDGNEATQQAFKDLGFEAGQVETAIAAGGETAKSTFMTMVERLAEVDDAVERERLGVALFGTMWEDSGAKAILSLGTMQQYTNGNIDTMSSLNVQYDTLGGFITVVKRNFEDWALTVINNLLPPLRELHTWITENKTVVDVLAGAIMGVVTAILIYKAVNFVMLLGGMVKAMYTAIKTTGLMTAAQTALNGAMMLNPIGLIIGLLVGLAATIIYLWNTNEGFRNFWINAWNNIKEIAVNVWAAIKEKWNEMLQWFSNLGAKIQEFKQSWINKWNEIKANTIAVIQNIIEWFRQLPQRLGEALRNCITALVQWVIDMKNKGLEAAQGLVKNVVDTLKTLPSKALEIAKRIPNMIWEGITSAGGWLKGKVSSFIDNIIGKNSLSIDAGAPLTAYGTNFGYNAQGLSARKIGQNDAFGGYKQTTNVNLNIGSRQFDNLVIKTVANNYGKIESIIQSKERGRR